VSTGETWFGERALEMHLIDEIGTSDAYLQTAAESADILEVRYVERKRLPQKLGLAVEGAAARGVQGFLDRLRYRDDPFI
jgi:serine protease SohB